jgi:glycosyltransferase involved in cell wall biosynthesis
VSALVSVVIPVYNGAATIGDTLRSLAALAPNTPEFEIVVVDNGSVDATREVARRFDVTLVEEATRGPAAARNRGLDYARGDIVAHCDADTVVTRHWLAELVAPLADPAVALVAGQSLSYRPETGAERYAAASGIWDAERAVTREPFPFAASLNMAVRRADALAVSGWDQTLMTAEDVDFSHRVLHARGGRIAYAPKAILFHKNRADDDALRRQARSYGRGSAELYLRHPDMLAWTPRMSSALAWTLALRVAAAPALALGARLRLASRERAEHARYHRLWTLAYWRGFSETYREGRAVRRERCSCV